ncbi:peroxisome proliferator-activated receptor gamma coactivator-related protein 1 [Melanotaenia boesemani]|uniref:peroxisome proliferator-activated receptor gamma coactivator-related protein 1 n=1 Tax=Melanotaenia boesemani TaxID=1250792 RepID=UPI001C05BEA1|nr:peroxisome proliferator-activated receptor gamma coactivator-related protein 1 [Melanotaenia boesemani]
MAARWGAGEETLTACNMEFFPMETLDQTAGLSSGETLEILQSCLDPSILSIFEDTPTVETKGLDEENEATLLTALTEILDNVDDENLSPFDTLPDSDLLSNQKGREHSPLRRMLCLSRSPQDKDSICSTRPLSTGKSLSRMQAHSLQRSDGEEEEDCSLTLSPDRQSSFPEHDHLDWEGLSLPLPVTLEQEGEDGLSVSLGDFVRHMHPYCMAICVENEHGEQMLPEGGILLEVVDQGENGEPILAIPNMDFPISVPFKDLPPEIEQKDSDEVEEVATDSSEHIIVDDNEDVVDKTPVKTASPVTPGLCLDVKDEIVLKRQREEIKTKSRSRRKKKKKCKEQLKPAEGRVLRSGSVRKVAEELPRKLEKESFREEKRVTKVCLPLEPSSSLLKSKQTKPCQTENKTQQDELNGKISTLSPTHDTVLLSGVPADGQPICSATAASSQQTCETANRLVTAHVEVEGSSASPSIHISPVSSPSSAAVASSESPEIPSPVSVVSAVPESKPKSLSLEEYRRLRQQKKPAPVEKQDDNSTKWPSLPELPKELPPIPCLPDPNPKDPRRANPQAAKKEVEDVRPAWQPRGPGAPPTPEALLVPPAFMISSSSKVAAATACVPKPQQTPDPSRLPPKPLTPSTNLCNNLDTHPHTTAQSAVPSLKPTTPHMSSVNGNSSPALTGARAGVGELPQSQSVFPDSVQLTKICPITTTDVISSTTAPHKTTVVPQEVPEVTASTSLNNPSTNDSKSSKPTIIGDQSCSYVAAFPSDFHSPATQPDVLETKEKPTTAMKPQRVKSTTQELIEAFTSEIGIEASDLTSLLEQFEETQAKEEQCVPEVSGRAAAVGNSSVELVPEKTVVERIRANDLSSTAALTPPATPPHQMWKPLAPVTLLRRNKAPEASKSSPSKVIQIEAPPLPSVRSRRKSTVATTTVAPNLACMDHDYCLPNKGASTGEAGKRWNVKQQSSITIKPIKQNAPTTTQTPPAALASSFQSATNHVTATKTEGCLQAKCLGKKINDGPKESSVLDTPDASPSRQESESTFKVRSPRAGPLRRSHHRHAASQSPNPRYSLKERTGGRSRKRRSHRSPSPASSCSDSYSSRSRSPERKRYRSRNSSNSSCSSRSSSKSSPSLSRSPPRKRRHSYSSSRSGSWSRSRSRSQSPQRPAQWGRSRQMYSPSYSHSTKIKMEEIKRRKEKAIEERRVVYVGRIRGTMTQRELHERFSLFGEVEECTLHFRDHGDNYGFVTYYDTKDAFTAIENGSKLRKPDELPFDLCFGGRRQFCQTSYSDLDSNREYEPLPTNGKFHALDFDTLLKQAQQSLKR